jgi:hemerythrin superfamily protein
VTRKSPFDFAQPFDSAQPFDFAQGDTEWGGRLIERRFVGYRHGYSRSMQIDKSLLPVRGSDAVEILLNDHEVIKGLLSELTQASGQRRQAVIEQLKGVLTIHNATEENLVYPAIDKVAGSKRESQHLYHETAEADVLLFELDSLLKERDESAFSIKAEKFVDAVCHHIEEEEQKAFPRLRENADPEHAETLVDSVKEFRNSLHFEIS